jgi:hypothetical protein
VLWDLTLSGTQDIPIRAFGLVEGRDVFRRFRTHRVAGNTTGVLPSGPQGHAFPNEPTVEWNNQVSVKVLSSLAGSSERNPSRQPFRAVRTLVRAVVSVAVLVALLVVILVALAFHKMPPPMVQIDREAATRLLTDLRQVQSSGANGTPRVLQIDEAELNSLIQAQLNRRDSIPNPDGTLEDVRVALRDDLIHVFVAYQLRGKDMTFDVEGRLHTTDGNVAFEPVGARVGALPVPRSAFQSALKKGMESPAAREMMRLPNNIRDLLVAGGKIIVTYR